MDERLEQILHKDTPVQKAYEKVLTIITHQRNESQNTMRYPNTPTRMAII